MGGRNSRNGLSRRIDEIAPPERRSGLASHSTESADRIARCVQRAKEDRFFFFTHYLPHLFPQPCGESHTELGRALDNNALLQVLAFRGWGKSTLVTRAETLRLLVTREVDFVVLTGRTETLTRTLVQQLRQELETNERLQEDFGPFEPGGVWQHSHFALANGQEVLGRPLGGTARGLRSLTNRRPQLWVLDDLQELEDGKRPERIQRVLDFFKGTVIPAMQPPQPAGRQAGADAGRPGSGASLIRVVGTKMSEDCAMARLEKELGFTTWCLDAEDGDMRVASDPFRFPLDLLGEYKTQLGSDAFSREYINTAISQDGMVRRAWLRTYRPEELRELRLACAVFWDPAIGPKGDYKAIVSLGLDRVSGRYYVLDAFLERSASPEEQVRELYRQWQRAFLLGGGAVVAGYETNGMQSLLEYPLEQHRAAFGLPSMPLSKIVNSEDKHSRVAKLVPLFERGLIHFDAEAPGQQALMDQWVFWPRRGTDGPDAMHGAWHLLQVPTGSNDTIFTVRPQRGPYDQ